jgi:hypothetical protein
MAVALASAIAVAIGGVVAFGAVTHGDPKIQVRVLGENFHAAGATNASSPNTTPGNGGGNNGNGLGNGGGAKLSFTMSATVSGLVLGRSATLPVQVTNPSSNNGTLTVNKINVTVQDITVGGTTVCSGSNLVVTPYDSTATGAIAYVIPQGGSATVPLPVILQDLLNVDQTPCKGKTFTLQVTGTATVTR